MPTRLTVTLCGSLTRAPHALRRVERALALAGHLVHAPVPPLPGDPPTTAQQYANLVNRHNAAIDRSNLVIAVVPDGIIGDNTGHEMRRAERQNISTRWAFSPADVDALIDDITADCLGVKVPA